VNILGPIFFKLFSSGWWFVQKWEVKKGRYIFGQVNEFGCGNEDEMANGKESSLSVGGWVAVGHLVAVKSGGVKRKNW